MSRSCILALSIAVLFLTTGALASGSGSGTNSGGDAQDRVLVVQVLRIEGTRPLTSLSQANVAQVYRNNLKNLVDNVFILNQRGESDITVLLYLRSDELTDFSSIVVNVALEASTDVSSDDIINTLILKQTQVLTGLRLAAGSDVTIVSTGVDTYPSSCQNGVKDGDETDVDCGGATCQQCIGGQTCVADADCTSLQCESVQGKCVFNTSAGSLLSSMGLLGTSLVAILSIVVSSYVL